MKLKKLILAGFKSFADRTEFDFDDGVSCVVGPNGCGKSNIVDAVKWVLGEQSAKSLRGSEMMDVIFNGSASRKAGGWAEVTLVFDNDTGLLEPNVKSAGGDGSKVVSISRRLFRDGQSEYRINKVHCRLKDIREMFMDTGIGTHAYSVIEQGRVELFLQASQDDRRSIFDEAAGISRYKARKAEALRKLDRVEQNLLRLSDVVQEVQKQLRSIKYQAGKARSYQTHSQRLKELRSLHFLAQYHTRSVSRAQLQGSVDAQVDRMAAATGRIEQLKAAQTATEAELADMQRRRRETESMLAVTNAAISTNEERTRMLAAQIEQLGEQIISASARCEQLEAKIVEAGRDRDARRQRLDELTGRAEQLSQTHQAAGAEHADAQRAIVELESRIEAEKAAAIEQMRRVADTRNRMQACVIRRENLQGRRDRLVRRQTELAEALQSATEQRLQARAAVGAVDETIAFARRRLEETRETSRQAAEDQTRLQGALNQARERRSGLLSRIHALQEMHQRLEGVSAGTKRVLEAHRLGRLPTVRGMLGDFLETDVDHAPVVEAALGGADERLIMDRFEQLAAAAPALAELLGPNGTAEVLCLDRLGPLRSDFDVETCRHVLARAIDWVAFASWLAPAMWRLLGDTLVVRTLEDARLAAQDAPAGYRFVTLNGDLVEPDGRVRLGAGNRAAGVIARRSELAQLESERRRLDRAIAELAEECRKAHEEIEGLEDAGRQFRTAVYEAGTQRVEHQGRICQLDKQIEAVEREQPLVAAEHDHLEQEDARTLQAENDARQQADSLARQNEQRNRQIEALVDQAGQARDEHAQLAGRMTETKVAMASVEQEGIALREALEAVAGQIEQMRRDLAGGRGEIERGRQRRGEAERNITEARDEIERLARQLRAVQQEAADIEETLTGLGEKLGQVRKETNERLGEQEDLGGKLSALRVELGQVDAHIEDLLTRASEEMGMDLLALTAGYEHDDDRDWEAVEVEIRQLKQKIERLGNVNLDAIGEQEQLEERLRLYSEQVGDIDGSRRQLHDLILRLNQQSRELFLATFEQVRTNFQELFRKLFGGGRADILLVDPEDVLESGLEIVARPPGKELRSLSLLSGGEKTMTALALLFSIFRARPSPFCLLDEVDAALDEANTERFSHLLREFVSDSQFIIISHAKRTMSMANVLYGVTMAEPGVSNRISVRFEDVGHTLDKTLEPALA